MGEEDAATLSLGCRLDGVFRDVLAGVEDWEPRPDRAVRLEEGVDIFVACDYSIARGVTILESINSVIAG